MRDFLGIYRINKDDDNLPWIQECVYVCACDHQLPSKWRTCGDGGTHQFWHEIDRWNHVGQPYCTKPSQCGDVRTYHYQFSPR